MTEFAPASAELRAMRTNAVAEKNEKKLVESSMSKIDSAAERQYAKVATALIRRRIRPRMMQYAHSALILWSRCPKTIRDVLR